MLNLPPAVRIFIARNAVDLRKGFDGLSAAVVEIIEEDPQSGHLFVFFNRRRNRVKILWWDRSGYLILYKRLEHGQFRAFDQANGKKGAYELSSSELALILEGIDLRRTRRRPSWDEISEVSA